ncbi:Putative protein C13orf18 [Chelonia mydas]|uniref:Rubicon Homology domain-containing protein n=1 Tax=Chelonia mydas TaxID=8469 RepID=M7C839_CHEMY|nr:Putative protein C13orf18 [Chelonia mydas]
MKCCHLACLIFRLSFDLGCNSAEVTAQKLYQAFRKCWLQAETNIQLSRSLNTTKQKYANKENIPKELESSGNLAEEIKVKAKLRGTTDWAPPRFQIIFSIHPSLNIWQNPIFNVSCINKTLYTKAKELNRVREIQEQLLHIKKLLKTCRFAESVLKEFEQVSSHLTTELHLFSMDDLVKIKRGLLVPLLRDILKNSTFHVENCELCQAKGFICEFCQSSDVLFPFQTATCKRCTVSWDPCGYNTTTKTILSKR